MLIQVNRHYYLMLFPDDVVCQSAQCRGPQFMAKWPTLRSCSGARRLMQRPPHRARFHQRPSRPEASPRHALKLQHTEQSIAALIANDTHANRLAATERERWRERGAKRSRPI